jgi:hypothetical protein
MISASKIFTTLLLACVAFSATAFAPMNKVNSLSTATTPAARVTTTALSERQWNFNEGQSPWGLKKNAETWNGRVAQVAFVWVFLQELITGKGIFKGLEEGNLFFTANLVAFGVCVVGLTGFLAFKGSEDYTKK